MSWEIIYHKDVDDLKSVGPCCRKKDHADN